MTATGSARSIPVRADSLRPGDVMCSLATRFAVESVEQDGDRVRVAYRYLDGRGIVGGATMTVGRDETFRVYAADASAAQILAATLGLPL